MDFSTENLIAQSIEIIKREKCEFFDDIVLYMPCSLKTLYNHKVHEVPEIKEALDANKIAIKKKLRIKWADSDNATLQIAMYRLLANAQEFDALCQNRTIIAGDTDNPLVIVRG